MNFSEALELIKKDEKLRRKGWNNNVFVFLVPGSEFVVNRHPLDKMFKPGIKITYAPHIDVCIGENVSVWDAQTMDILGEDWEIYA
jgi:hypothetical protein